MNDKDFFDLLFQQFTKTTQAETAFWMPEDDESSSNTLHIYAVDQEQKKTFVAGALKEADADFITAIHGCMPDLVRRLHAALDEADRLDVERDEREQEVFRLAVENEELKFELQSVNAALDAQRSKAADVLWKIERPM